VQAARCLPHRLFERETRLRIAPRGLIGVGHELGKLSLLDFADAHEKGFSAVGEAPIRYS